MRLSINLPYLGCIMYMYIRVIFFIVLSVVRVPTNVQYTVIARKCLVCPLLQYMIGISALRDNFSKVVTCNSAVLKHGGSFGSETHKITQNPGKL